MPQVSQRGTIMPASPIRRLVPLANAAKNRGVKVYHLNIGQPDVPTPEEGLEALKHIDRKVLESSSSAASDVYKRQPPRRVLRLLSILTEKFSNTALPTDYCRCVKS